jgi:hypothetical protein
MDRIKDHRRKEPTSEENDSSRGLSNIKVDPLLFWKTYTRKSPTRRSNRDSVYLIQNICPFETPPLDQQERQLSKGVLYMV